MSPLDEHVHDGRGDGLGRGVHAERRVRRDGDLLGVGRIGGRVSPAVADRAVEHDAPVLSDAQLDRRVHAGLVPVARGLPDPFDGGAVDFGVVLFADRRHGVQVGRDADLAVGCHLSEGTCHPRVGALLPGELRRTLGERRRDAFGQVLGRQEGRVPGGDVAQTLRYRRNALLVKDVLDAVDRQRRDWRRSRRRWRGRPPASRRRRRTRR